MSAAIQFSGVLNLWEFTGPQVHTYVSVNSINYVHLDLLGILRDNKPLSGVPMDKDNAGQKLLTRRKYCD